MKLLPASLAAQRIGASVTVVRRTASLASARGEHGFLFHRFKMHFGVIVLFIVILALIGAVVAKRHSVLGVLGIRLEVTALVFTVSLGLQEKNTRHFIIIKDYESNMPTAKVWFT
jgi:hypothetical protein